MFSVRNAIKRKKDLFSLKRSATCAMAKNNLLKRFATSAHAEVAQLALCASNCGMPTSVNVAINTASLLKLLAYRLKASYKVQSYSDGSCYHLAST